MTTCTIVQNLAEALTCLSYSTFVSNSILWGNIPEQIYEEPGSGLIVVYNDIEGGWPGQGNIDADPCFVETGRWVDVNDVNIVVEPNDANAVWLAGDYRLRCDSYCIDAAKNDIVFVDSTDIDGDGNTVEPIPFDLDGNARIADGNNDGNSVVDMGAYEFFVPPIEVPMKFTPQVINPLSKGNWIKGHFVLPAEYSVEDVDANQPAFLQPIGITSCYMNVYYNDEGLVEVEVAFDRSEFCNQGFDELVLEVRVLCSFTSGLKFYGTEDIKIIDKTFQRLAGLAYYWLVQTCEEPDWCEDFDINMDGSVNFLDLVLLDGCCVELADR